MKGWKVATYLLYAGLIIWIVAPFVYLFLNSLKSNYELFSWPPEIFSLHTSMQYGPLTNYYGILIYWLVKGKAVVGSGYSRGAFPEYTDGHSSRIIQYGCDRIRSRSTLFGPRHFLGI